MISPQYVDGLELRIKELEAQLADTEKERDEWKDSAINGGNAAYLREQLAELKKQEPWPFSADRDVSQSSASRAA